MKIDYSLMQSGKIKIWKCKTCGKTDDSSTSEGQAKPEHIPHRGFDIGNCEGKMELIIK